MAAAEGVRVGNARTNLASILAAPRTATAGIHRRRTADITLHAVQYGSACPIPWSNPLGAVPTCGLIHRHTMTAVSRRHHQIPFGNRTEVSNFHAHATVDTNGISRNSNLSGTADVGSDFTLTRFD